ncbi:PaaI family thioesterase [Aspergillus undulatus]|uniref:PaaI family thioesterase n=1 Tax=Aspergillus undulatus TaxID=1810928 RepID=UPI003CCCEF0F
MAVLDRKVLNLKSTLEINQETHLFAPENTNEPACILFAQLGNGLNGFEGTVHGGVIASLIDESLSLCVESFRAVLSQENAPLYTAKLAIFYRKPVQSPNIICVKTWLQKKEGRKWYLKGELVTEDGQVRAVAESLWISARKESAL